MNYSQIKDHIVRVDNTIQLIPEPLLRDLLGLLDPTPEIWNLSLYDLEVPGVKCIVHALNELDTRRYYTIATITVENVPAFYFTAGGREGRDYYQIYILNECLIRAFIKQLVTLSLDKSLEGIELFETGGTDYVVDPSEYCGLIPLQYGEHQCSDNPDEMWVQLV